MSIDGAGSGVSVPSALRSNSMNTLFQISISGIAAGAAAHVVDLRAAAARPGLAHLPEVVVGAELEDAIRRHAKLRQMSYASSSRGMPFSPLKIDTTSRSAGIFQTSVSSVQANGIASFLK